MRVLQFHEAFKLVGGQLVFSRMKGIVEVDGTKYLASWHQRGPPKNLAFDDLIKPKPLKTEDRGPEIQKSWKKADTTSECYIKAPKLEDYADSELEQRMLREIEVCETLRQSPHPNIATYKGYRSTNGRVTGLCFEHHGLTLLETVNPEHLNKRAFTSSERVRVTQGIIQSLDKLLEGILHIHSQRYAHNDISPANIVLDKNTSALVLIDFGSCCPFGDSLAKSGRTPEWHDAKVEQSTPQNDLMAFEEIKTWLRGSMGELQW